MLSSNATDDNENGITIVSPTNRTALDAGITSKTNLDIIDRVTMPAEGNLNVSAFASAVSTNLSEAAQHSIVGNGDGDDSTNAGNGSGLGISLMQSSPPPHSYRHSRAYRHFKNPPQPHMCIRTTTEAGEELFINVLSWTRIVIPQEPSDPIPLYGGMRVPPGSPRSPPIVFAVMANPEVLKDSGRHSKDPEERRAMVELMCDFVEAMNPGVKLVRNALILKDRDISGELKDVWNAVQAQRDREREEQMLQQRQQQHYHNVTTQQMFPKSAENARALPKKSGDEAGKTSPINDTKDFDPMAQNSAPTAFQMLANKMGVEEQEGTGDYCSTTFVYPTSTNVESVVFGSQNSNKTDTHSEKYDVGVIQQNGIENKDQTDASNSSAQNIELKSKSANKNSIVYTPTPLNAATDNLSQTANHKIGTTHATTPITNATSSTTTLSVTSTTATTTTTASSAATVTPGPATISTTAPPPKKDKLAGFLPNGCIFPRFKNNKHKDKDKEKEPKSRDKEKTLLHALKKSKDKKVAAIEQQQQHTECTSTEVDTKSQYDKTLIHLDNEVQKLDLNKIDTTSSNENMFIKLKVAATSAAAK